MEKFELTILGCGSALPTTRHFATSQVINIREKLYMIDCGEGAQLQLRRSRLKFSRLNHIFISHLHGDHCFGLIGLISTFGLLGRTAPLYVHAPAAFGWQVHLSDLDAAQAHPISRKAGAQVGFNDLRDLGTLGRKNLAHRVST